MISGQIQMQSRGMVYFSASSDKGAVGDVDISEVFAELQLPIKADMALLKELTFNLSGRLTDHEYYGENETASVKVGYRPMSLFVASNVGYRV